MLVSEGPTGMKEGRRFRVSGFQDMEAKLQGMNERWYNGGFLVEETEREIC